MTRFGPKKSRPRYISAQKSRHFLMHLMSVKLPDNFQIREHSWPCLFHIKPYKITRKTTIWKLKDSCCSIFIFGVVFCRLYFVFVILIILLSVLLRFTAFDYPCGISKLVLHQSCLYLQECLIKFFWDNLLFLEFGMKKAFV